jgi:hypothetical protein
LSGDVEDGLRLIEESLGQIARPRREERSHPAEVLRLKGEILLMQEGYRLQAESLREKEEEGLRPQAIDLREKTKEVEVCFLQPLDIARQQQAKS